jgi:hypothetical protein
MSGRGVGRGVWRSGEREETRNGRAGAKVKIGMIELANVRVCLSP